MSLMGWKEQGENMRFYQGDHAYEVEKVRDPGTQLYSGGATKSIGRAPSSNCYARGALRHKKKRSEPAEKSWPRQSGPSTRAA